MIGDLKGCIARYRSKGVFLDSNLLVLLFVGLTDPQLVGDFKRTKNQGFEEKEFSLLQSIISNFGRIITTPHILAETSNFVCQLQNGARLRALQIFADTVQSFKERRPESKNLAQADAFLKFGLTDSSVLHLPPKKYLVLSIDAKLVIALQKMGIDAINFNHLRQLHWQL